MVDLSTTILMLNILTVEQIESICRARGLYAEIYKGRLIGFEKEQNGPYAERRATP